MFHSLWARQLVAAVRQLTIERSPEPARSWPEYFDNTEGIGAVARTLFYKDRRSGILLPFKGRAREVSAQEKIGIEAHITAVTFGTTRSARKFWRKQILDEQFSPELLQQYAGIAGPVLTDEVLTATAERMALHQRFWKVPYHYVGLLNGDVLHNNLITRHTHHGNGGNRPLVGVSLEGNYPGLERKRKPKHNGYDGFTIETGRAALRLGVLQSRAEGAPIEALYAHRQYSNGRRGDPGEGFWREIGIPLAKELHLERRVTFSHGSGTEVCRDWDELGMVDYRGRSLSG